MQVLRRALLAGLGAVLLSAPSLAQEAINFASVSGRVVDETGGVIPGAAISARQLDTAVTSKTVTDHEGRFRFAVLPPGAYEFTIALQGFAVVKRRLTLSIGAAFNLPVTLKVGITDSTTVTVDGGDPVEAARGQISVTIGEREIKALPINGRAFLDLALLAPGVSPTNVGGGTQLFPETSAVPGVGLSIGSQRNLSNNFMVDGLSANDDAAALSGISFSVDAIGEFQVVTSGGQAELGRALGGHINIATKSGTNFWKADGYGFFRDDRFNGRNALTGARLPMHQNQFGASLGGPIRRNHAWFFVNLEQRSLDQSGLVTIAPEDVAIINARLAAVGYAGPALSTGLYRNPIDTTHVLGKIDHLPSDSDRLSVRYSSYDASSLNSRGVGGLSAASASAGLDNLDQTLAVGNSKVLSTKAVFETRGQIARGDLEAPPADPAGPAVNIAGIASFGRLSTSPTARLNTMMQVVNNFYYQAGAHGLRAGVDWLHNDDTITFPRSVRGSYSFSSLASFLAGTYNNNGFTQTFGDVVVPQTNGNVGIYLQDEWHKGTALTVNAGLRYDLQYLRTVATDYNNVSPRLGAAWSPFASQRALVRGSIGRFYDRIPLRAVANALLSAGNTTDPAQLRQIAVGLSPGQSGAPVFPAILTGAVPTSALINFTTIDRALQNAYSDQFSLEFEQQLSSSSTASATYQYLRGRGLLAQINQNVPACAVSGNNNGCRPNPAFANNNQYSAAGRSVYHGLHLSYVQRFVTWASYRLAYTYSRSMNNVGETFFASPIDPHDIEKDWGRSDDDQRHRLVMSGSISTPASRARNRWEAVFHGFQFSGALQYYSALPFNITTGANTIQGTAARPVVNGRFIARNAGEGSSFSTTSLRVSRSFAIGKAHVDGLLEVFNLFDRRNDLARVTVFGSGAYPATPAANFGQVTVVGDPRSLQLGFRIRY